MPDSERISSELTGSHGGVSEEVLTAQARLMEGEGDNIAGNITRNIRQLVQRGESLSLRTELIGANQETQTKLDELLEEMSNVTEAVRLTLSEQTFTPQEELGVLKATRAASGFVERQQREEETTEDFYTRYGIQRPQYEAGDLRSNVRVARSMRATEGSIDEDSTLFQELLTQREYIEQHLSDLQETWEEKYSEGTPEGREAAREIASQIATTSNLRAELVNILEHNASQNANAIGRGVEFFTSVIASLGVVGMTTRFALTEPYRFGTQPALGVVGQQGEMGGAISQAYSELEAYNLELNTMMFQTGAGSTLAGVSLMMNPATRALGATLTVAGTAMGTMGLFGVGDDFLRDIGLSADEDQILGQSLAQQFSNPQRLMEEFQNARVGLYAMGGRAGQVEEGTGLTGDFGFVTGPRETRSTGNVLLDRILGTEEENAQLRALGYDRESIGRLATTTALAIRREGDDDIPNVARFAAQVGGAFGIGEDAALSAMQTAQRFGSRDVIGDYSRIAGVFAEEGEDGELTIQDYSMNVLVPALMQVTESMTLRNLARSTDDLMEEVTTFGRTLFSDDREGRLAELARVNPEIIGRMLTGLQESAQLGAANPAVAALDMSLGASLSDIFLGRANVAANRLDYVLQQGGIAGQVFESPEDILTSSQGVTVFRVMQELFPGFDPQSLLAMAQLAAQGSLFTEAGEINVDALPDAVADRLEEFEASRPGEIMKRLSDQVDEFMAIQTTLIPSLIELQEQLGRFLGSPRILEVLESFIEGSAERLGDIADNWDTLETTRRQAQASEDVDNLPPEELDVLQRAETDHGLVDIKDLLERTLGGELTPEIIMAARASDGGLEALRDRLLESDFAEPLFNPEIAMSTENDTSLLELLSEMYPQVIPPRDGDSRSVGGFTGFGSRHQAVGTVHAGEYVISSDKVAGNRETLDRIQSGERVSDVSVTNAAGNVSYVTLKVHGASKEEIIQSAKKVTEDYIIRNRLHYT